MKKLISVLLLATMTMTMSMSCSAEDVIATPDGLIMATVREVLEIVKHDKTIVSDQPRLQALVNEKILPHFDFTRMTQLAVGPPWRSATPEQKEALVREFRAMLVRTYTQVFSTYPDPEVEVKSAKLQGENEATVRSIIRVSDGRVVTVDYEMRKKGAGWKAFDVTVQGISMVISYRGSFADEIKQVGIDGLIKTLSEKNRDAGDVVAAEKKGQLN